MDSINFFEIVADSAVFSSALDKAIAKTKEFASEFNKMSTQVTADSAVTDEAASRVHGPGGSASKNVSGLGLAATGAMAVGYSALAGVAAVAGAGAVIQNMVSTYASFSAEVLRNSQALDINAQELQTWMKVGELAGVDAQSMQMDFDRFAKNLADGATTLKATGVDLQDLGITSTNTGTAILQLADYLHTHTDASQNAAIATALFGRSGAELLPILEQGSSAFRDYEAELQKMGVLLSNSDLVAGAQAETAIQQFGDAFEGAKNRFLSAVLPGFTTFFSQLTAIVEQNGNVFTNLGNTVDNVLLTITGLLAGLTGQKLDLATPVTTAASAYEGLAGATQDASTATDNSTEAMKAQKDALAEVQAQTQLEIDTIDVQIQALDDQTSAYNDSIDAQKQALQDQYDQETYVTDSRRRSGEDLVSYERRLDQLNTQQKIKALDDQKATFDRTQQEKKQALDDERANLQRVLNEESQAYKQASTDQSAAAVQPLTDAGNAVNNFANNVLPQGLSKMQQQMVINAQKMGQSLDGIFSDKDGARQKAFDQLGQALGQAFADGFFAAISGAWSNSPFMNIPGVNATGQDYLNWLGDVKSFLSGVVGHAEGTISLRQHLAMISEGNQPEAVIPLSNPTRSLALMQAAGLDQLVLRSAAPGSAAAAAGGTSLSVAFYGPVATEQVAAQVTTRLQREARRKGLLLRAGMG